MIPPFAIFVLVKVAEVNSISKPRAIHSRFACEPEELANTNKLLPPASWVNFLAPEFATGISVSLEPLVFVFESEIVLLRE